MMVWLVGGSSGIQNIGLKGPQNVDVKDRQEDILKEEIEREVGGGGGEGTGQ
jgi:hypothetical protein